MKKIINIKNLFAITAVSIVFSACTTNNMQISVQNDIKFPKVITIKGQAQNPEGIEYDKNDNTFLLSSLNTAPIMKVNLDGTYKAFTSGEKFPLSTAGLQIDYKKNRLLVAGFNGIEAMDNDPKTKGASYLRIYNLRTGILEKDINLSHLAPKASAYFANDIAVDNKGNVYISDWYAHIIYKVDTNGTPSIFWKNNTKIASGPNGLDFHEDGYLLVSILNVNDKWLYSDYGLVKIPVNDPNSAKLVNISNASYTGFDGMLMNSKGNVVGVTNNGKTPGGNKLLELSSIDNWRSAKVINSKDITASTTVALTQNDKNFVINQDFSNDSKKYWTIEQIKF